MKFGLLQPSTPLTIPQKEALKSIIGILSIVESTINILGREKEPGIHIHDHLLARIIAECKKREDFTQPGICAHQLAVLLKSSILRRR